MEELPLPRLQENRVRLGWRNVVRVLPDGRETIEEVPLTLEDMLHPQIGDTQLQTPIYERIRGDLGRMLKSRLGRLRDGLVLVDCLTNWGATDIRDTCGDLAVFEHVVPRFDLGEDLFRVQDHGARCVLVVEITSKDTRVNDVEHKVRIYERLGIPLYVIVDRTWESGPWQLIVYRPKGRRYERRVQEERDGVLLDPLDLKLVVHENQLDCLDSITGEKFISYGELLNDRNAARLQLQQESERRIEAERRAQIEQEARVQLEQRLRELEEQLKRGQNGPHGN